MPTQSLRPTLLNLLAGLTLTATLVAVPAAAVGGLYLLQIRGELSTQLEQISAITPATDPLTTEIFARGGEKIGEVATERRFYLPLRELPPVLIEAFLSAEDRDFYHHHGISPTATLRALVANLRRGRVRQGGSTITQQLARLYFLDQSKTWERKVKEAMLALALERRLSKDQILELYLNKIYLGNGSFGVEAAARNYYRKSARDLNTGEAAMLAGLPKSPSAYAPHKHLTAATARRRLVLQRMVEDGVLAAAAAKAWAKQPLHVAAGPENFTQEAPYVINAVSQELARKLEVVDLGHSGLRIYTTLDMRLQKAAARQLDVALKKAQGSGSDHGGELQGALLSLDPNTGGILAMQGGRAFNQSQFNRAEATRRPLAALFLPVYIGLALESGFTMNSRVGDDPISGKHLPTSSGSPTLRDLLTSGDVLAGAPLYASLGGGSVRLFAKRLGLEFRQEDMSLAIGAGEATPTQTAVAYAAIANGGHLVAPYLIDHVTRADGTVLYEAPPASLEDAMKHSTATVLEATLRDALRQAKLAVSPLAGGLAASSEDLHDGWFVGTLPNVVSALWLGAEHGNAKVAATPQAVAGITGRAWSSYMLAAPESYLRPATNPRFPGTPTAQRYDSRLHRGRTRW